MLSYFRELAVFLAVCLKMKYVYDAKNMEFINSYSTDSKNCCIIIQILSRVYSCRRSSKRLLEKLNVEIRIIDVSFQKFA